MCIRDSGYGDKKTIPVLITPTTNTKDVYTVSGNIELSQASESDVTVTIKFMSGAAQIKKVDVIVPAGAKTQAYTVENLSLIHISPACRKLFHDIVLPECFWG